MEMETGISPGEARQAAGPDLFPPEIYKNCDALRRPLSRLFTEKLERAYMPKAVRHLRIVPLAKPVKDPTQCTDKGPIALLSPLMRLLGLILAGRVMPWSEQELACEQYAYRRARSTELLLRYLYHFVTTNRANQKLTYLVGLDIFGAFDNASHTKLVEPLIPNWWRLRPSVGSWGHG